nr:MAG TPA: hypothetical protein [Caudoviricetes sp.]
MLYFQQFQKYLFLFAFLSAKTLILLNFQKFSDFQNFVSQVFLFSKKDF